MYIYILITIDNRKLTNKNRKEVSLSPTSNTWKTLTEGCELSVSIRTKQKIGIHYQRLSS